MAARTPGAWEAGAARPSADEAPLVPVPGAERARGATRRGPASSRDSGEAARLQPATRKTAARRALGGRAR
eukprot:619906-Alexandrium_andersonii.AAC.1